MLLAPVGAHFQGTDPPSRDTKKHFYTKKAAKNQFVGNCKGGSVLAYAAVNGNGPNVGNSFAVQNNSENFNCLGAPVEVKRVTGETAGAYELNVPGFTAGNSTSFIVQVSGLASEGAARFVNWQISNSNVRVNIMAGNTNGTLVDGTFHFTLLAI